MKLIKNRYFLLFISLFVSALIAFVIIPAVINAGSGTVEVVRVNKVIKADTVIERSDIEMVRVGRENLPGNIIKNPGDVVGKYTKVELLPSDNIVSDKLADKNDVKDSFLYTLAENNRVAVSITVKSFAAGVSGKIKPGDIVSIVSCSRDNFNGNKPSVIAYLELEYVEVASVNKSNESSGDFGTITVIVSREQALLIVEAENIGSTHVVFVGRGDKTKELLKEVV